MNFALGCAFSLQDLFINFPTKKLKMTCEDCKEMTGDPHRMPLIKQIFKTSMKLIFNDIISNNNTFQLPTSSKKCETHVTRVSGEDFKIARQKGAYKDVDILASNFTGNCLTFNMYSNNRTRVKPIYLDKSLKGKLTENTNKQMQYC